MLGKTNRETIMKELIELLESSSVKKVIRSKRSDIQKEFVSLPDTDFPLVAIDCGLPQTEIKFSSRQQGIIDEVRSTLNISLYVYLRLSEGLDGQEDEQVSNVATNLWSIICNNPNVGKAFQVVPNFSSSLTYVDTYCYFTLDLKVQYVHDRDSL